MILKNQYCFVSLFISCLIEQTGCLIQGFFLFPYSNYGGTDRPEDEIIRLVSMRDIYISSNLDPLTKFTSCSRSTKLKDIIPWNVSQILLFWIYFFLLTVVFVLQLLSLNWEILIILSQFPLTFHQIHNGIPRFIA